MNVWKAILLGLIQGLTEFLPISSSGHLALASSLFGLEESPLFLDALLHLGTLIAVFIAFRKLILSLIRALFGMIGKIFRGKFRWKTAEKEEKMLVFLILSCLPLFLILPLKDSIEKLSSYIWVIGIALIVNGIVLFLSDSVKSGKKDAGTMTWKDALVVGVVQTIAVTPGISRSGSTITAGLFCGFDRKFAAQYSFILSIPTILAGAAVSFYDALKGGQIVASALPAYLTGMVVSAVVGFFAIRLLEYLMKSRKFFVFAVYTISVGLAAVIFGLIRG